MRRANRVLKLYDRGDDIRPVRQYLICLGYLRESAYSPSDLRQQAVGAIKRDRKNNGLPPTGAVDLETRSLMVTDPLCVGLMEVQAGEGSVTETADSPR